jgi:hypothetical protein
MEPVQEIKRGRETGRHISQAPLTHVFAWLRAKDREMAAWWSLQRKGEGGGKNYRINIAGVRDLDRAEAGEGGREGLRRWRWRKVERPVEAADQRLADAGQRHRRRFVSATATAPATGREGEEQGGAGRRGFREWGGNELTKLQNHLIWSTDLAPPFQNQRLRCKYIVSSIYILFCLVVSSLCFSSDLHIGLFDSKYFHKESESP